MTPALLLELLAKLQVDLQRAANGLPILMPRERAAATLTALHPTCRGVRLVIQITPDLHDRWAIEARALTRRHVHTITHYEGIPVHQLPNLAPDTAQVVACWDCMDLPTIPDDPDAIARFLT